MIRKGRVLFFFNRKDLGKEEFCKIRIASLAGLSHSCSKCFLFFTGYNSSLFGGLKGEGRSLHTSWKFVAGTKALFNLEAVLCWRTC